jgi:cytochrome c biogenesis protein ResB
VLAAVVPATTQPLQQGVGKITPVKFLAAFTRAIGSAKLALVLIFLMILMAVAGAIIPQEGLVWPRQIDAWQQQNPILTSVFAPIGFFHVFLSIPFLLTIFLLGLNTLTCTIRYFAEQGYWAAFKGPAALKNTGFLVLHISLIFILAGGCWSAAASMDGFILLTEGQSFNENHDSYLRLREGRFRRDIHKGFNFRLDEVKVVYKDKHFPVDIMSHITVRDLNNIKVEGEIRVNRPFTYKGLDFTPDQVGFSPRIGVRDTQTGKLLLNAYIALKTTGINKERTYSDFLLLEAFKQKKWTATVTLLPEKPMLQVHINDESGKLLAHGDVPKSGHMDLAGYTFYFTSLRHWASFRIMDDPGYKIVWPAIWLALLGLFLRYIPELKSWLKQDQGVNDA